uniref:TIR domain-containing protein n=2 Tax=Chrysotila carterae TaxID=13221 RepID=A0A6S9RE15_CHRCT|mmetsp:Transcript_14093/g.29733  ORF Transcript_14093/g.29733 Transcript_14093/m.29733 type:complete len:462 (-) Transcript_14093:86-1471(-)
MNTLRRTSVCDASFNIIYKALKMHGVAVAAATASALTMFMSIRAWACPSQKKRQRLSPWQKAMLAGAKWGAYISRDRDACAVESLWVQAELEAATDSNVYLDCEETYDPTAAAEHIQQSAALVVLQTRHAFLSAHRIFEVLTAVKHGIPIVMVRLAYGKYMYDIEHESVLLQKLASSLSPSSCAILELHGFSRQETAETIRVLVSSLISITMDSSTSRGALVATSQRLTAVLNDARPWTLRDKSSTRSPLPYGLTATDTLSPRASLHRRTSSARSSARRGVMRRSSTMDALPVRSRQSFVHVHLSSLGGDGIAPIMASSSALQSGSSCVRPQHHRSKSFTSVPSRRDSRIDATCTEFPLLLPRARSAPACLASLRDLSSFGTSLQSQLPLSLRGTSNTRSESMKSRASQLSQAGTYCVTGSPLTSLVASPLLCAGKRIPTHLHSSPVRPPEQPRASSSKDS